MSSLLSGEALGVNVSDPIGMGKCLKCFLKEALGIMYPI